VKEIFNWQNATVSDIESDNLLDEVTLIHVLSYEMQSGRVGDLKGVDIEKLNNFFKWHIDNKTPIVMHNGIGYDIPLAEKILNIDLKDLMLIDTLALSWYLNTDREVHGLDSFFEDYGIAKPKIDDWENLTFEEYQNRCREDVKINKALWEDLKTRLIDMYSKTKHLIDTGKVNPKRIHRDEETYLDRYVNSSSVEEYINRCLTFLMFKMDCARLQEKTRWKVDVNYLQESFYLLDKKVKETLEVVESVMPPVAKYGERKKPEEPLKKDGTLKVQAVKWNEALENIGKVDEWGNELTKIVEDNDQKVLVLNKYEKPNGNSPDQLKNFFFRHGWKPDVFKYVKDKEAQQKWVDGGFRKEDKPVQRKIPQINKETDDGKTLCDSLVELAEEIPEIKAYDGYSVAKNRYDTIKGFMRDLKDDHLKARIGGFTNTLRVKHRELVNLVGVDKPYGENIRGGLICEEDEILLGSDLSSLEDRTKHHFMLPHDPKYVETMMADDYDPHILTAHSAGLISDKDLENFKSGLKEDHVVKARKGGKSTNYACLPVSNTKVKTKDGFKYLDEIIEGEFILGFKNGEEAYVKVERVDTLLKQAVYKIALGGFVFSCSKEHAWVTKSGFTHSDDLVVGDEVFDGSCWLDFRGFYSEGFNKDMCCVGTETNNFFMWQNNVKTLTGNCVYGGSPEAIARSAGVDLDTAKKLHTGYWNLNWSVKTIAEEQCVFKCIRGKSWLINPINGICYSLRTEKDRFSTLCQGSGSFFFDMWVDRILEKQREVFKTEKLTGSFHDEVIICFKDSEKGKKFMSKLVTDAIDYVTEKYLLRRKLGCDVQYGKRYSEIH
jgi:hypothetical protein